MCRRLVTFLLLASFARLVCGADDSLRTDLRYTASSALRNTLEGMVLGERTLNPWLFAEVGGRLAASNKVAERIEYKGEAVFAVLRFLALRLRLTESYRFNETVSATSLVGLVDLHGSPFPWLDLFFQGGWYERYTLLSDLVIIPVPLLNSYHDHDFAVSMGFRLLPVERWAVTFSTGNLEEIVVYNLDNPYLGLEVGYRPLDAKWEASAYCRYKILLGFGRLDELMLGVGLKWDLTGPS